MLRADNLALLLHLAVARIHIVELLLAARAQVQLLLRVEELADVEERRLTLPAEAEELQVV